MAQTTATGIPSIGDVIRAWRIFRELSSGELAEKAGVRPQYLSEIEHNRTTNPWAEYLEKLAGALEVPLQDIYGRRMPPKDGGAVKSKLRARSKPTRSVTNPASGIRPVRAVAGAFGSGVGLGTILPRSRTGQQQTDTGSQQRDQTIKLLVAQIVAEGQLTLSPEQRMLAERLISENARSVCEVLAKEQDQQRR